MTGVGGLKLPRTCCNVLFVPPKSASRVCAVSVYRRLYLQGAHIIKSAVLAAKRQQTCNHIHCTVAADALIIFNICSRDRRMWVAAAVAPAIVAKGHGGQEMPWLILLRLLDCILQHVHARLGLGIQQPCFLQACHAVRKAFLPSARVLVIYRLPAVAMCTIAFALADLLCEMGACVLRSCMCNGNVTCSHSCPADGHRAAGGTHLH